MPSSYTARQTTVDGVAVVELVDALSGSLVAIAPAIGNMAYRFEVRGRNVLWFPFRSPAELRDHPQLCGIPFLAPWANRLDEDAFWANGHRYILNPALGNIRRDAFQHPIHGLLNFSPLWQLVEAGADDHSAWAVSRLEFWRHPSLMAQFPFAHTITITHRLAGGRLEVETALQNHSADPMPVAVGFHPYFQLHDAPRDSWTVHLAARERLILNSFLIPTGESRPIGFADPYPLAGNSLDDGFGGLIPGPDGRPVFWVQGLANRVSVVYGPKYPVAIVYAPPGRDFICFEPMSAVTNGFNLAHSGAFPGLQSVAPGGLWQESFWIQPEGF